MEEQTEGFLKEKEQLAHLAMIPVAAIPIVVSNTEPSSSSTVMESTLKTSDSSILVQYLTI